MKSFDPMSILLWYEGYPPAILAAVVLHGFLLYFLLSGGIFSADYVDLEQVPTYINATTADVNPQRLRRIEMEQAQAREAAERREQEAAAARTREQQQQAEQEAARREAEALEQQRQQELAEARQRQAEADRQAEELRRQQQEAAERERQRQEQLARERQAAEEAEQARQAAASREAEQAAADARNVQSYTAIIHDTVTNNWVIPPSARNGMTAVVRLRLVPTGEIISSDIIRSSGDDAFDRSVLQAVDRSGRFPELQEMSTRLFEENFRVLTLTFRPEDLLR